jgi:hypothetical protein
VLTVKLLEKVREVPREEWDAMVSDDASPFVEHTWLDCLEEAGCVKPENGWLPRHMALYEDDQLVAVAPSYVKGNSEGEFVFDWAWADVSHRIGVRYYPKILVAVPFTPATGDRVLTRPGVDRAQAIRVLANASVQWAEDAGASSVHVNFPREDEARVWQSSPRWLARAGFQYHFHRRGAGSWDDYLARFNSKKRHQIKREVAQPAKDGVVIETLDRITPEVVRTMYRFYTSTVDRYFYGHRYLNERFFELIVDRFAHRLAWVVARQGKRIIAGAFNVEKNKVLYGRYWGTSVDMPFLHFNVCYYEGIRRTIERGLDVFEPGAGGEHKRVRGFDPTLTHSAHWVKSDRLRAILAPHLEQEKQRVLQIVRGEIEDDE